MTSRTIVALPRCNTVRAVWMRGRVGVRIAPIIAALLIASPVQAQDYYGVGHEYRVFALSDPNGQFSQVILSGSPDPVGPASFQFDTGTVLSGYDPTTFAPCSTNPITYAAHGVARARVAVDLASGSIAAAANSRGFPNIAQAGGELADTLTFTLPNGVDEVLVTATLTIVGDYSSAANGTPHVTGYAHLLLEGHEVNNGGDGHPFIGQAFAVTATVEQGDVYVIRAFVRGDIDQVYEVCGATASFDFNAFVTLDVPAGVTVRSGSGATFGSASGVFLTAEDTDADGSSDLVDNCLLVANTGQHDADGDGFGNRCDADLNNDCLVNFGDLAIMKAVFLTSDPVADFNGDGAVNFVDLAQMRSMFFGQPGPSAQPNGCSAP